MSGFGIQIASFDGKLRMFLSTSHSGWRNEEPVKVIKELGEGLK